MTNPTTLYVDGACRGNPGLGGWGVYIQFPDGSEKELFGGEPATTNNRMELSAAIHGISDIDPAHAIIIWTDSSYVQKGMSEWLAGWKKRNWRKSDGGAVLNADLWQQLDVLCADRNIEWKWIKGHAGHAGNERADQLANKGADLAAQALSSEKKNPLAQEADSQPEKNGLQTEGSTASPWLNDKNDWLSADPLGLGFDPFENTDPDIDHYPDSTENKSEESGSEESSHAINDLQEDMHTDRGLEGTSNSIGHHNADISANPQHLESLQRTDATVNSNGKRQLILDTETTGFGYADGDRIIEVGAIEMINRKLTGSSFHVYINPQRPVGDSENIHGLSDTFLSDKPLFAHIVHELNAYLDQAEIIAHNANFDMNFLEAEFARAGLPPLKGRVEVTDTLAIAKRKHPGQKNSLDALVRRYEIQARDRTFHGALLDAEILADVYLAMTGGQVTLDIGDSRQQDGGLNVSHQHLGNTYSLPVILASEEENKAHQDWLEQFEKKNGYAALWTQ